MAVNHREPPRIPFTLYLARPLAHKLELIWGPRPNWPCPPDDIIRILWNVEAVDVTASGFKDRFGCQWRREAGGYIFVNPPITDPPDVNKIPIIDLVPRSDIDLIMTTRQARPDAFIFYQFTNCLGERLWCLRGLEQTLMDYILEPSFVHQALDRLMEMHMRALDKLLSLPIDGVTFGDDFGTQKALMISKEIFRTFYKERLRILYDKVRSAGKIVGHHSCGNNTELMRDFVEIGLQVFHPLQPEAMDIRRIKREYGSALTFRGGIGTQGRIVFGSPEEARREVREAMQVLSKGGGYFLETAKPLPEETPVENAMAVIEEMTEVMHYRF